MQKLPYYETVKHKLVSLKNSRGYVIPMQIPTADMDAWEHTTGEVFLPADIVLNKLYKYIGCHEMTEVEIYCDFIFVQDQFNMMTEKGRKIHLKYIKENLLPKLERTEEIIERAALMEKLGDLAFIPDQNGELQRASEFFDPSKQSFQSHA